MQFAGWGNYPKAESEAFYIRDPNLAYRALSGSESVIARGAGRSYGDAAIGIDRTALTGDLDRIIAFDRAKGLLTVEAGAMLGDVIRIMLPRGYFPAVVPGTQFVTIGGMVAANVHGKNHHGDGGFGRQIAALKLLTADGCVVSCSATENPELFYASIGGMGLTGIITTVTFRLTPIETAFIRQETLAASNLDAAFGALEASREWTYAVAWIDTLAEGSALGRSLVYRGEHALRSELDVKRAASPYDTREPLPLGVPFDMPNTVLNRFTVRAFNALYYKSGSRASRTQIVPWSAYFFPLDTIANWNRIYGRRGLIQHQSVIPKGHSRDAIGEMLGVIARSGNPSFLGVLKLLGADDDGLMSFPMEGYTLAIDFPISAATLRLAGELDRIVAGYGGRLYLAKDARQDREMVEKGYPNLGKFRDLRRSAGASGKFRSLQSERLAL